MAELSSEDKTKYIKIRDNYQKTKKEILDLLEDKSNSSFTNTYRRALDSLTTKTIIDHSEKDVTKLYVQTGGLVDAIDVIKRQINNNITATLESARPIIPGAEQESLPCDMKSVFFIGRLPQGGSGPDSHYKCVLCGRNNLSEHNRYDTKKW